MEAQFFEPGGLAVLGGKIYVADTNNHQIRVLDIEKNQVSTLELKGLEKLVRPMMKQFWGRVVTMPRQTLKEGEGVIRLNIKLPAGYQLNSNAPVHVDWKSGDQKVILFGASAPEKISFPFEIPVKAAAGNTGLTFDTVIYYCAENSSICLFDHLRLNVPVEVSKAGASVLPVDVVVK